MKLPKQNNFSKSRKCPSSEKAVAKNFGRRQPASGAMPNPYLKGDVSSAFFLLEIKDTTKDSFRLEKEVLCKIGREAEAVGKLPALCLFFHGEIYDESWVLVPYHFFKEKYGIQRKV